VEAKLKHLELAQAVINRMASNSFSLKTWGVTLVSAIVALATKDGLPSVVLVAWLPIGVFWFLDANFLRQERLYRELYNTVRLKDASTVDFDLNAYIYKNQVKGYIRTMWSITLASFYGGLFLTVPLIAYLCYRSR
jgi:hypothetical protein